LGEDLISSHAWPYSTVAEFFENSSEVRAYTNTAVNPAPNRMTNRFVNLAVDLTTDIALNGGSSITSYKYLSIPFPPVLNSDHFFWFPPPFGVGGMRPS
jgi:hypothetical protein